MIWFAIAPALAGGGGALLGVSQEVDGKWFSRQFFGADKFSPAPTGKHVVALSFRFQPSFFKNGYEGRAPVRATFSAGHQYESTGVISGRDVSFWIRDAKSKKRVSSVAILRLGDCWVGGLFCPPEWIQK